VLATDAHRKTDLPVESPPASDGDAERVPEQPFDAADVFAHADTDPLAERTLTEVGRRNALGVAATVHAFAPEAIRVGGAVALENQRAVLEPIRERLSTHLAVEAPTIDVAALGDEAVLLGALAAAIDVT
jgi:glucokinase